MPTNLVTNSRWTLLLSCAAMAAALLAFGVPGATAAPPSDPGAFGRSHRPVCGPAPKGAARCHSEVVTDAQGDPMVTPAPNGYGPTDLQSAYNIFTQSSTAGGTQTIAIVDAYDDPNAEADLGVYRSQYGLPACTTANGCFKKVNQTGGSKPTPPTDAGWAQEISLDLDMASAICPNCKHPARRGQLHSLRRPRRRREPGRALGADVDLQQLRRRRVRRRDHLRQPLQPPRRRRSRSAPATAATARSTPRARRYVTAVGGTSLHTGRAPRAGWTETAWSGAGSGCSATTPQAGAGRPRLPAAPSAPSPTSPPSPTRTPASPSTTRYQGSGWLVFGGTSASAPIIAGFDALTGSAGGTRHRTRTATPAPFDITSGSNGSCGGSYLCTAQTGFDGPTGLGTPKGSGGTPPNQPPSAAFTIAPNLAQTGDMVTFNGSGSSDPDPGDSLHYKWDLDGNGSFETDTGTTPSTSRSYATAQSITVRLRVTDNSGATNDTSHQLTVNSPTNQAPTARFTISPNPAQSGQAVSFDGSTSTDPNQTSQSLSYQWNFGDGRPARARRPSTRTAPASPPPSP